MRNFASTLVKFSKLSHIQTTIWRPPKMAPPPPPPPRTAGSAGPFVTPLVEPRLAPNKLKIGSYVPYSVLIYQKSLPTDLCRKWSEWATPFFDCGNFGQKFEFQDFELHRQDYTLNPLIFAREKRCNCLLLAKTIVGANYRPRPFLTMGILGRN